MRFKKGSLFWGMKFLYGLIFVLAGGFFINADAQVLAQKTINRTVDQVTINGKVFKDVVGKPVANLRVYACKDGAFEPIRYQIDEMTTDNDWILPDGPRPNSELANGKFDTWDKLTFMIKDLGDKASPDLWTAGYTKGEEIEITDPLTGGKGWCYMLYFSSNIPSRTSKPDYVSFDYKTARFESNCHNVEYILTKDGKRTTFYQHLSIPESAGGTGNNYVDRLKIRPIIKIMFGKVTIKLNEESVKSNILSWKIGPIRWIRRAEQYTQLPGGGKALRVIADCYEYENLASAPVLFNIPFRLDSVVTSAAIRFGTDYSPEAIGAKIYSSSIKDGFLVDGKMDNDESTFSSATLDQWRMITGKFGTFITRTMLTKQIQDNISIPMGYIDDINLSAPPEKYPGTLGFLYQDWVVSHLQKGKYYLFLEFYYPDHYKRGDEVAYVNYLDNPVKIQVGSAQQENEGLFLANVGKKYL
jgi:hypothetical protein